MIWKGGMMSGTTFSFQSGLTRTEKREIIKKIKKIWGSEISETFVENFNGECYINISNDINIVYGDLYLGDSYDTIMDFLLKKQRSLRLAKLKRIMDEE